MQRLAAKRGRHLDYRSLLRAVKKWIAITALPGPQLLAARLEDHVLAIAHEDRPGDGPEEDLKANEHLSFAAM